MVQPARKHRRSHFAASQKHQPLLSDARFVHDCPSPHSAWDKVLRAVVGICNGGLYCVFRSTIAPDHQLDCRIVVLCAENIRVRGPRWLQPVEQNGLHVRHPRFFLNLDQRLHFLQDLRITHSMFNAFQCPVGGKAVMHRLSRQIFRTSPRGVPNRKWLYYFGSIRELRGSFADRYSQVDIKAISQ